jgi:adenylyltransferase/sulfurtransferase
MEMPETFQRYARQMMLPGWNTETQEKLTRSKVFVAGAGGLGCPVAVNLAVAGVGTIRLCDADVVALSNLNRQFLHDEQSIHTNKADSARATLSAINSRITVEPISDKITDENVDDMVQDSQVIVDCVDNFATRIALNRCSVRKGIPMSIHRKRPALNVCSPRPHQKKKFPYWAPRLPLLGAYRPLKPSST